MRLFEAGKIGGLIVKNRIVMAAMGNGLVDLDGRLSQRGIDFYLARAKGGTGLVITCPACSRLIEQIPSTPFRNTLAADSKMYTSRLNELAEGVHDYGARVAIQVTAGQGRNIRPDVLRSVGAVAPSPLPAFADPSITSRELTVKEIKRLILDFRFMAEVIRGAGIDAIEINAHAGYLCDQFMTALWNKRTDEYGGDLDGRLRFLLEIIDNIKKGAGVDFPVVVKFALTHYLEGGREIREGLEIARRLEVAGVDALTIDAGCYESQHWTIPPTTQPQGCLVDLAQMVKRVVKIPVISIGKLGSPELAERILEEGKADFIALGRSLLADPEWVKKVEAKRLKDICPCIGDHDGCHRRTRSGKAISCTVNPACGMENGMAISRSEMKKFVVVVGGGPAGMEAARVATLRGHKVILFEKQAALGGNLIPASVPDFKREYRDLIDYLSTQINKLGVELKLSTEASSELVQEMKPDVLFIATGGIPIVPEMPGVEKETVATAIDVLLGKKQLRQTVVVIGGGGIGCETALHLAKKGKKVTVVEMLDSLANDVYLMNRMHLLRLMADANVVALTGTRVVEITDSGVTLAEEDGKPSTLRAETVVLAVGLKPNVRLSTALKGKVPEIHAIGDCVEPRKVVNAISEGFRLARLI